MYNIYIYNLNCFHTLYTGFFYVFVGAPTGPDPRRDPGGPRGGTRAQGRAH